MSDPRLEAMATVLREHRAIVDDRLDGFENRTKLVVRSLEQRLDAVNRTAIAGARPTRLPPLPTTRAILVKSLVAKLVAAKQKASIADVVKQLYGADRASQKIADAVNNPVEFIRRSLTNPAVSTVSGWAAELVGTGHYAGPLQTLAPTSIYATLARLGLRVDTTGDRATVLPYRTSPGSTPSPFVAEAQPIPSRQFSLAGAQLTPKKASFLSLFTGSLMASSVPAIESVVLQCLEDDLSIGIDSVLISKNAATAAAPAGLLSGVVGLTPATAGSGAMVADLGALAGALKPAATDGVYIMNPIEATSAALALPNGIPALIISDVVPPKTVVYVDASDFSTSSDDAPEVSVTEDAAVLQDDAPSGSDLMTGHPVTSLWQHNLYGVRVIEFVDWKLRRGSRVAYMENVTW